ncbi:MAG: radical SAM protein [Candidatus Omnitrophota bacterium]|nr:radical SAM protein [Candidatus Omnitrophota bacterium]
MAEKQISNLRMVAWEVSRSCNLSCAHCRAASGKGPYPGELSTEECFKVIDEIVSFARPVIILTGGEPLLRKDIFEIAEYGKSKDLIMVMASNGTLLSAENVAKIIKSGIKRISVSLDGPDAAAHDNLRQVAGAFNAAVEGIKEAKKSGLQFQINSTITKRNVARITEMMNLSVELGARAHHIFLLVPTGRAKDMLGDELSGQEYEDTLKFLTRKIKKSAIEIKVTCGPHFNRLLLQQDPQLGASLRGRGCMAGVSFCFISHLGDLQPCGYLEIKCGNARKEGFKKSWLASEVFNNLRDFSKYVGKCGICEFRTICAGCRARAYAISKNYLTEEPYCVYVPKAKD